MPPKAPQKTKKEVKGQVKESQSTSSIHSNSSHSIGWIVTVIVIGLCVSFINTNHLTSLFENDRHFSHLADFEREMTYRTEMGLYYSYYKTLIEAPSFFQGLRHITHDNVTEYGHTMNTLKRFNLYPEVILAVVYRQFKHTIDSFGWKMQTCWQVNRGKDLPPIESCEGIANPHYFYINSVFLVAGTVAGIIFVFGVILSDSILGGLLAVSSFAFNHGESTRVQWTPPLRESWSYPFILAQITIVTLTISSNSSGSRSLLLISIPAILSMLSWQFSQFVYSTQLVALALTFSLDFIPRSTYSTLIFSHMFSLLISFVALFGNEMLLSSMYFPCIISSLIILFVHRLLSRVTFRPFFIFLVLFIFGGSMIGTKIVLAKTLNVEDDAHIFDILRSKFSDFASFHTRLYTCSAEFGFIQQETIEKLTETLVLPCAIASLLLIVIFILRSENILWRDISSRIRTSSHLPFHFAQTLAFTVMAILIMRLKLFMTPHLCVSTSLLMSSTLTQHSLSIRLSSLTRTTLCVAILSAMAFNGIGNINKQLNIQGEYSNVDQEMLFEWIDKSTPKDSVFAGTMPVMANVKLSTGRPIVNHPHYEDVGIRNRTLKVYSIFSKKPIEQVHNTLKDMGVDFIVIQPFNCDQHPRKECSYRSMWDLEDPLNSHRRSLCDIWQYAYKQPPKQANNNVSPFSFAYNQANYIVLRI